MPASISTLMPQTFIPFMDIQTVVGLLGTCKALWFGQTPGFWVVLLAKYCPTVVIISRGNLELTRNFVKARLEAVVFTKYRLSGAIYATPTYDVDSSCCGGRARVITDISAGQQRRVTYTCNEHVDFSWAHVISVVPEKLCHFHEEMDLCVKCNLTRVCLGCHYAPEKCYDCGGNATDANTCVDCARLHVATKCTACESTICPDCRHKCGDDGCDRIFCSMHEYDHICSDE